MAIALLSLCIVFAILFEVFYRRRKRATWRTLPPGPRPLPIIGNIRDLPPEGMPEYQHWLKHKDTYGGISSVTVMGMTLVIIHDRAVAQDLLVQQASKTSGRPRMVMANEMCGYGSIVLCQGYTTSFRRCRKLLHQELGTTASAAQFQKAQEIEVQRQLVRGLRQPEKWLEHFKTTASATVLNMAYGYSVEPHAMDPLVSLIDKTMLEFSLAAVPMAWAVDIMPALRHLPEGFPGAKFQQTARLWRKSIEASAHIPYRFALRQMAVSTNRLSYVSKSVEQLRSKEDGTLRTEDENAVIWTAASLYGAAADTTVITLTAFTLAMIKYPHVQRRAQAEIDRVIGTERLPTFVDRKNLPYVDALVKEAMRWWPIAPMGFPHLATDDIGHPGVYIPKGAYILPAVWWFLHDPEVYHDPESFDPSRFLPPRSEPDPSEMAFGFGRRICPGRFFADSGLYLNIAQSLTAFSITEAKDAEGKAMPVGVIPRPGILMYPTEFQSEVRPRSDKHVELIRQLERRHPMEESDAQLLDSVDQFKME